LERFLGGGMTPADEETLEAHVAGCRECQDRLERLTRNEHSLPSWPRPPAEPWLAAAKSASVLKRIANTPPGLGTPIALDTSRNLADGTPSINSRVAGEPSKPSHSSWPTRTAVIQTTRDFVRRQYWTWPLIAALILGIAGWTVNRSIEGAMRDQRINELTTILNADVAALKTWMTSQRSAAELLAEDAAIRLQAEAIVAAPESPGHPLIALSPGTPARERAKPRGGLHEPIFEPISPTGWPGSDSQATSWPTRRVKC
jgi:hypothetical protein